MVRLYMAVAATAVSPGDVDRGTVAVAACPALRKERQKSRTQSCTRLSVSLRVLSQDGRKGDGRGEENQESE